MKNRCLSLLRGSYLKQVSALLLLAISLSVFYICLYYNDGGNLHDAGVYFESGLAVLHGHNPYEISRWGSFGPVPFSLIMLLVPDFFKAIVIRCLSLVGLFLFLNNTFTRSSFQKKLLIFLVLIWTSPVRELMVTNQMTGIAIGVLSLGIRFLGERLGNRGKLISGTLLVAVALDLKPHICIFLFLAWVIYTKSLRNFIFVSSTLFLAHGLIDLSQMRVLEYDWYKILSGVTSSATKNTLGDSLSFWPLLNHWWPHPQNIYIISGVTTLVLSVLCIYFARTDEWEKTLFLALFIPTTLNYFHFYDLVPLCVLYVSILFRIQNLYLTSFTLPILLIPKEYLVFRNQILVLAVLSLFIFHKKMSQTKTATIAQILLIIFGLLSSIVLHTINRKLNLSEHLLQSLITTESAVIILFTYLFLRWKKITLL